MHVLVAGGTGFIGTALCEELAARGHDVTALAREPDSSKLPESVAVIAGDVTDHGSLESAFAGTDADAVVNLVALSPLFRPKGGSGAHDGVHRCGTENLVAAAERHGVDRFVQMSGLGADAAGTTAFLRAKGRAEEAVRDSELDWTVVRPSVVFGDGDEFVGFTKLLTTPYVTALPGRGETRFQPVWVGDLAPVLAATVEDDAHVGETYEIGGPEVLTLADVARAVYRSEGKSLRVLPIPMPLAGVGLTVAEYFPPIPMGRDQYRSLQLDNTVESNDVRAFGVDEADLRTFGAYLSGEGGAPDDATVGPGEETTATGSLFVSLPVVVVFAFLTTVWLLQHVVEIYATPVIRWLFVVPYLVTVLLFDNGVTERLVYAVDPFLPVPGAVLWEAGNLLTYYLFSLAVGAVVRLAGRVRETGESRRVSTRAR